MEYSERCEKDDWSHLLTLFVGGRDWQTRVIYIISIIFLGIMIASDVVIANSDNILEEEKPSREMLIGKYIGYVFVVLFNVYIMDCVLHGGCNWYATIVAILSILGVVALAIIIAVVGKSVLLMREQPKSRGETAF